MTRISSKMTVALAAATLGMGVAVVNCSKGTQSDSEGNVTLALSLPDGEAINTVNYVVLSSGGATLVSGTINTSDPNATASVDVSVPASMGDTLTMTATTNTGSRCTGTSAPFSVAAGGTTLVGVALLCDSQTGSGSVIANGTFDKCPALATWMASPLQTSANGGRIDVSATATDGDPTDVLTFAWTATNGSFVAPTASATQYICGPAGPQTLTVVVSDNHQPTACTARMTFPVTCVVGPGGTGGSGTGGMGTGGVGTGGTPGTGGAGTGGAGTGGMGTGGAGTGGMGTGGAGTGGMGTGGAGTGGAGTGGAGTGGAGTGGAGTGGAMMAACTDTAGAACFTCESTSSSATCSAVSTHATSGPAVGGGTVAVQGPNAAGQSSCFGCSGFVSAGLSGACNNLLACIRSNMCVGRDPGGFGIAPNDPTPCACGIGVDPFDCAQGGAAGPCLSLYQAATATALAGPSGNLFSLFFDPHSPVGIANNVTSCDVDAACGSCGVN